MSEVSYGAWDTEKQQWWNAGSGPVYVSDFLLVQAACQALNSWWRDVEILGEDSPGRWQSRIIDDDDLPKPVPSDSDTLPKRTRLLRAGARCPVCKSGVIIETEALGQCIDDKCSVCESANYQLFIELMSVEGAK
ncbi:MAG: hypothetical protein GY832_26260 [Chloroflexi bacterium]|nr:hypothetical protein [Chloroflexota bacterium]